MTTTTTNTKKTAPGKSKPGKVNLSPVREIPFNKLVLSQANVRKVKAGQSIEDLAEDIANRTLLQSLAVRPIRDEDGNETGAYEVPAGGRRFRALQLLVKQKRLARTAPVPCIVREDGSGAEDSLAENVHREALHPLDQFRAFQTLQKGGLSIEDIAARFFVTPAVVRQRLKLTAVSPRLLAQYAEGEMDLEQLMAFTVTDDHARQEQVWETLSSYGQVRPSFTIRRLLTETAIPADDRRARFVGAEAYAAAGGIIMRDLFSEDDGGWFQDMTILERLVGGRLTALAGEIKAEGWAWVEAAPDFPYGHTNGMRPLTGEPSPRTEAEEHERHSLLAEIDRILGAYGEGEDLSRGAARPEGALRRENQGLIFFGGPLRPWARRVNASVAQYQRGERACPSARTAARTARRPPSRRPGNAGKPKRPRPRFRRTFPRGWPWKR
ncbi:ParB/RepB/Spo0J family partition protein [Roseospira marina]|uniref:ParB/RepB/Spo0J family partition protein n=1 Tax=Roseospira marina TaxID=140057 RepID=A0A5M6I6Y3_9PROT|nr:ParB/RepB/Spo0J family partition protein [Roseospira marina]MBB4315873.1 ParB/RepB/Spo0J family partition protein [Roseospira marina]MBB5089081.1 ParB/RepB/Spo0J family partition protein [Roseospira marina]